MPSHIVKPIRDEDFYLRYSTVVDSPCEFGTRAEMLAEGVDADRLDRADAEGTSARWGNPLAYGWDDDSFVVREGMKDDTQPDYAIWGEVPRTSLRAFCETLREDGYFHPPAGMVTWVFPDE